MANPKIKVYIGISGSGKTTLATDDMRGKSKAVRVNRDDLRYAIYGLNDKTYNDYFEREDMYQCEQLISDIEDRIINKAIAKGKVIYADNTHLKQKYIKKYYDYGVPVELIWVDCDLEDAVERDKNRSRSVGRDVVEKQFNSYQILKRDWKGFIKEKQEPIFNDIRKPKCVIFDIDGTLAIHNGRSPYDYTRVSEDSLNSPIGDFYKDIVSETYYRVFICSGRENSCKEDTIKWLKENNIHSYESLIMRKSGDNRSDYIVKEEMWRKICKTHYIQYMVDDRKQVIDHARRLGFTVFDVAGNEF